MCRPFWLLMTLSMLAENSLSQSTLQTLRNEED
jgi:hypothetical protein